MIMYVISVKDLGAQIFSKPQFVSAPGVALRSFMDEVNRAPSPQMSNDLFTHPDDFELYELGLFDDSDGSFEAYQKPKLLAQAKQFKQAAPADLSLASSR